MNKVFWTQVSDYDSSLIIIDDNNIEKYNGSPEQQDAMGKLIEVRSWSCLSVIAEQRHKFSKGFHVAIERDKGITIRSFHNENGVRLPYTYYSTNSSIEEAFNDLEVYSKKIGRILNSEDFDTLLSEINTYISKDVNYQKESKKVLGGGYEKIWQYIRRH